ncbi:hypothetical protein BU17DRAFT_93035 [Hysterangium stoloniferum]|nr:hypothetical protein BU17DRAFT_93035 [Hysterangium stoloniferum]
MSPDPPQHPPSGSTFKTVVTAPPWAEDEPESPAFEDFQAGAERSPRPSGVSTIPLPSISSARPSTSAETLGAHHRWNFAFIQPHFKLKRHRSFDSASSGGEAEYMQSKTSQPNPSRISRPRWGNSRKRTSPTSPHGAPSSDLPPSGGSQRSLRLQLPLPQPKAPFTLSYTKTPGWNTPWTPRIPGDSPLNPAPSGVDMEIGLPTETGKETTSPEGGHLSPWGKKKRKLRSYILHNNYVPLVSRVVNITFTTVALAFAVRIRVVESSSHLRGAVGSSPFLAVIFAPATLVHVMVAIYLEYFGRPLGLWRTSAKLAHTLLEVLFICIWSAELALCFDNYTTSMLHCTPPSAVSWYSELPPVPYLFGQNPSPETTQIADRICDYQRNLIGVVMVALVFYITNLIISLFRIFEKVKVRQGWGHAYG